MDIKVLYRCDPQLRIHYPGSLAGFGHCGDYDRRGRKAAAAEGAHGFGGVHRFHRSYGGRPVYLC